MTWPACGVCGRAHRPARLTNGGPARCYHCGETARSCACADATSDPVLLALYALGLSALAVLIAVAWYLR